MVGGRGHAEAEEREAYVDGVEGAGTERPGALVAHRLRCEYLQEPLAVDQLNPLLSWALHAGTRGKQQTAFQILVAGSAEALAAERADIWDSGKVTSGESIGIPYRGPRMKSFRRYHWCVRAWDEDDVAGPFSDPACWGTGILDDGAWDAAWIGLGPEAGSAVEAPEGEEPDDVRAGLSPAPYFRRSFDIDGAVSRATVYATAKGVYELHVNGARVGDQELAPGWTDYRQRLHYQAYDVTELLTEGENVLGAILGDGWYASFFGMDPKRRGAHYGKAPRLLAQLVIDFGDGRRQVLCSDGEWASAVGPVLHSDLLIGEAQDARRELPEWNTPGFKDASWRPVVVEPCDAGVLEAQPSQGIRVTGEVPARSVRQTADDVHVFDLGQNIVGRVRLTARGAAGTTITLRHAEAINGDGSIYTANLRSARQTDTFILNGEGEETFEPRFTVHGFRYVEVTGYPGDPPLDALTGRVLHSDTPPTGHFECSSELVNRLQSNIVWGQRGNFLSVPTDCPQRDERLGWTGDAQVFVRTACFNMEVAAFFEKWLRDLVDAQSEDGAFPDIAPLLDFSAMDMSQGAPAWGDAGVIVPWTIYTNYANRRILERCYPAMERWMDYLRRHNPDLLRTNALGNNYGDWLSPGAQAPKDALATAYWAYDAALMARISRVLGREQKAQLYAQLFEDIKAAFNTAYVDGDGRIRGDVQTCYVLALHMNLVSGQQRTRAAARLVELIEAGDWHLSTGFAGVSYLCPVLTDAGFPDVAYRLLLNETYPSWGYTIRMGATTIWERWDGWTEEGGFQSPKMNSFNHYSLGSVGEWLYRYVAGLDLDPSDPGYRRVRINPHPGGGLTYAHARYDSVRGPISSGWSTEGMTFRLDISLPANTTARVSMPVAEGDVVKEGGAPVDGVTGIKPVATESGRMILDVASGDYSLTVGS